MHLRLLAKPLLAIAFWSSLASCSKKDNAAPAATGTYTRNGVITPCQVAASTRSGVADYLELQLTPTDPKRDGESVRVTFMKSTGTPTTSYKVFMTTYAWQTEFGPFAVNYFPPETDATLVQLSSGRYSGTFSATFSRFTSTVITAGAFTNVQL